jgi:Kef-type K+ transport system membrane component KefB
MRRIDVVFVAGDILPPVSFSGLAIVAAVAFLVSLLLGLAPQLRLPSAVVEIVVGIVIRPSVLGWVKDDLAIHVVALMGLAVLQATSLSFVLVAVDLGQKLHLMTALTGSALIAGGRRVAVTCALFCSLRLRKDPVP